MADPPTTLIFRHSSRRVRRRELGGFLRELCGQVAGGAGVTCLIADDDELRGLNLKYRGKNKATDVLSFPSGAQGLGDIAISLDRATAQAAELGHSVEDELRILMLHGVLHLTGMNHESDTGEMARAELRWRKKLGLPMGLIERVQA